jgi:dTDP-4-amino-4,6-dideoxygalactose transaminase
MEATIRALGIGPGDEVIVPTFTFTATANAVVMAGATPVFVDAEEDTFGPDPADIKRMITDKTKAIMVLHYAGMPCRITDICAIAATHGIPVIEDAAHCVGSTYNNTALGTFGTVGVYSFHGTKNVCTGEGGALLTNSEELFDRMEQIHANGTNRRQFLKGQVDKYSWVTAGSSYFLSEVLASIGVAQLPKVPEINAKRSEIAQMYTKCIHPYEQVCSVPRVPHGTVPNWHIYALRMKNRAHAETLLTGLRHAGIGATTHYVPLHSSPFGKTLSGSRYRELPIATDIAETIVRLPIYPGLTPSQVSLISEQTVKILKTLY